MKVPLKIIYLPNKWCRFHKSERRRKFGACSRTYPSPLMSIGNVSIGNALLQYNAVQCNGQPLLHTGPIDKGWRPAFDDFADKSSTICSKTCQNLHTRQVICSRNFISQKWAPTATVWSLFLHAFHHWQSLSEKPICQHSIANAEPSETNGTFYGILQRTRRSTIETEAQVTLETVIQLYQSDFSQSFTKITIFIAYLRHSCNTEPKITAAKPTTDDVDWLVWLAQPISDVAGSHVTTSSAVLADVSGGQCREEFLEPGTFCFVSRAVRRRHWTILSRCIRNSNSTSSKCIRNKTTQYFAFPLDCNLYLSKKRGKILLPTRKSGWASLFHSRRQRRRDSRTILSPVGDTGIGLLLESARSVCCLRHCWSSNSHESPETTFRSWW